MDRQPHLVVTGASGFLGSYLVDQLKAGCRIDAIDRHAQVESGVARHPNVRWHQLDLRDGDRLARVIGTLRDEGGADALVHLAANFDFTGEEDPEYRSTNVDATRHLLELACGLGLRRFVFASSVAACRFPPAGRRVDEESPADGEHPYAVSKRRGEELMRAFAPRVPTAIVRLGALFSDWCEYPPLFVFLEGWLAGGWRSRVLGGRGLSAVPYVHVRDAALFLRRVLARMDELGDAEVLVCSPDHATSHRALFDTAHRYERGGPPRPILVPRPLAWLGMAALDGLGRLTGRRPFERPWMARYIDRRLEVSAGRSRRRLTWAPRPHLDVAERLPFLLENRRADPVQWERRNRARMETRRLSPGLLVASLLDDVAEELFADYTAALVSPGERRTLPHYRRLTPEDHHWHHRLVLHSLSTAIRTGQRRLFRTYCEDLAEHRLRQGFDAGELIRALRILDRLCVERLARHPGAGDLSVHDLREHVSLTVEFGIDRVEEMSEAAAEAPAADPASTSLP